MPFITHENEQVVKVEVKKNNIKYINLMTETTYNNFNETFKKATKIKYDDIKEYIIENWSSIVNTKKEHQINILTMSGWRTVRGFMFKGAPNESHFYDESDYYEDYSNNDEIIAIQIVEV